MSIRAPLNYSFGVRSVVVFFFQGIYLFRKRCGRVAIFQTTHVTKEITSAKKGTFRSFSFVEIKQGYDRVNQMRGLQKIKIVFLA